MIRAIIGIWFTGVLFISCSKKQEIIKPQKLEKQNTKELVQRVISNQKSFDYLFAKFSAKVNFNDQKYQFKGALRVRSDSAIWISITKLGGVEMVRMIISQDSIKMINKWDKNYFVGTLEDLKDFAGVNAEYGIIEDFLLGEPIEFDPDEKYKSSDKGSTYLLSLKAKSKVRKATYMVESDSLITIETKENKYEKALQKGDEEDLMLKNFFLYPTSFLLAKQSISLISEQQAIEMSYQDYNLVEPHFQISFNQTIRIASSDKSSRFDIQYSSVKIDQPISFPFKISSKYVPIKK